MSRAKWMDKPHAFRESSDMSMCRCGVPALEHWRIDPLELAPVVYGLWPTETEEENA